MTRREILEKNWKEFRLSTGLKYEPMSDKAYEFMENAMEQYAELRLGGVVGQSEELVCDHPDDAIIRDKPTDYCMACNRNI
jgi:hypothetical protein